MSDMHLKPKSYGHVSTGSMDTNASTNAESTISMALSKFPEPPSSTPSTPLRSEFGGTPSPSRTAFFSPSMSSSPSLRLSIQDASRFNSLSSHATSRDRFLKTNLTAFYANHSMPGSSKSPSAYDSDGASTIDVDTIKERILSTSSLLQENRAQLRRLKHNTSSDTASGISEMTYSPHLDQLDTDSFEGPALDLRMPPSAYSQFYKLADRVSGDSETLHSNQDHRPMIRTTSISGGVRVQGASVVGVVPATLRNFSGTKSCTDKSLQFQLPSTYGADHSLSDGYKVPSSIYGAGKSETPSMTTTSRLSSHQLAINDAFVPRKKRMRFVIIIVLIIALGAIGAGVGGSIGSRKKYHLPTCAENLTGAACNLGNYLLALSLITLISGLDATCVCTSSVVCNGLAKAVVDLIPMVNQNFATNMSLASAYNNLWMMQGSSTTSNCASQALLADVGSGNNQNLYPNSIQWAQTALLWNAIQTQNITAAGQLQRFVQKIPWTSLGTTDGPISTANTDQKFSTTIAGFTFNFASQTVTQPSASFVTLGQPTNAQISRVSSQTQTTLDRMYAFAQGMSFSQYP